MGDKMKQILRVLGERVRKLRMDMGLTQEDLAEKLNLHGSYVGLIERGQKTPSLETLKKIAEFFGLSISGLLATEEEYSKKDMRTKRIARMLKGKSPKTLDKIQKIIEIISS
jgi:transcriptional regulator with XRE-family HTH domain